jgi:hypothetical protein
MDFAFEESYIGTQKNKFESLFNKKADDNLNEFLMYLNEKTNRTLISELEEFNKNFEELKESGILDNLNK